MKERRISLTTGEIARVWSALLIQLLGYHCAACTVLGVAYAEEEPTRYLRMLLLIVPLCYLLLVHTYVTKFILFLLLHIPVFLIKGLPGSDLVEVAVWLACVLLMCINSIYKAVSKKDGKQGQKTHPYLVVIIILLICHYVGYYRNRQMLIQWSYYEMQLFIVLYLVHISLVNTSGFIRLNQDTANFPIGQMTIINRLLEVLFLVVVVLAMTIFPRLHLDVILIAVLKGGFAVLAWLLSLIKLPEMSEQVQKTAKQVENSMYNELAGDSESWGIWELLARILESVAVIAVVSLIVGGIACLLYYMYKGFYAEKKENTDEREFLVSEMKWFSRNWFSGLKKEKEETRTMNQRVRKVYRCYVKKGFKKKERIPETMTPDELLCFLKEKHGGISEAERCKALQIYEQARYGQRECTADELEELKRLLMRA